MATSRDEAMTGEVFPRNPRQHLIDLIEAEIKKVKDSKGAIKSFVVKVPGNIRLNTLLKVIKTYRKKLGWTVEHETHTDASSTLTFS